MCETLAAYSLMGIAEFAELLSVSVPTARQLIDSGAIPSVPVGKTRRKVDPIDAVVHILAGREGLTPTEYWRVHGDQTPEYVRKYIARVRKVLAA